MFEGAGAGGFAAGAPDRRVLVEVDPRYFRPTEVEFLRGDAGKARAKLGWRHSIDFEDLVREMMEADRAAVAREHNTGPGERR